MNGSIVSLKNVEKWFGENHVVKNMNLEIQEGEFLTLLGPSGCGKTTTLRMIAGFEDASSGTIEVQGVRVEEMEPFQRDVNTVFQNYSLFPHMTVFENVAYGPSIKKIPKEQIKKSVSEMLELVQMSGYESRKPDELSGGQKQRVAIARALINQPRVLLLDEPLGALDMKLRRQMQIELKRLQKKLGITFVYVTHDQEEAMTMSDRIAVMSDGLILQIDNPVEIYEKPKSRFVADFIGESNILPGKMIEDYLVEFNGKRFEAVDGGMRPNEQVEVIIRPEDLRITLPEEGKLQVKVDTQLFRGVHYEIIAYDELGNEWMIHSTRKAIVGEEIGLQFEPEDIHIMRLNETEEEFDARIEEYVEMEEQEAGLINAIEEERDEENNL